jgi:hypothetical protein
MTKAVFIIGNKRSGSTHLMKLMNLHPQVFVSNESDIIWILYRFHHNLEIIPYQWDSPTGMNATLERYISLLSREKSPSENFITIQTTIMRDGFLNLKPMQKEKVLWIGDQKPFQQIDPEIVPFLKEHFPDAKYVHLVRHPFPVVKSARVFFGDDLLWKGMPEAEILKLWTMHENWVKMAKDNQKIPILDVRYEDIISQTQHEVARIFDFLELEYDSTILQQARKITSRALKLHPRLPCPPETQAIMSQYGYKTKSFWLEQPWYVDSVNFFKNLRRKVTKIWQR